MPATKDQVGRGRRRIVAQRLREFFVALLARLSGGSAELFDKAKQASEKPIDKRPPDVPKAMRNPVPATAAPMMLRRPVGFIEPCLPSKAPRPPSGLLWIHEIKYYRLMVRQDFI